jgi:hypothetical protein
MVKTRISKVNNPSILVNPLRHNGIIGSSSAKVKGSSCAARVLGGPRWSVSPECLAFVQVRRPVLVTWGGVWNPGRNVEGLKYSGSGR